MHWEVDLLIKIKIKYLILVKGISLQFLNEFNIINIYYY